MAQATNSPVVFDCATCKAPIYYNMGLREWKHQSRTSACGILIVVVVPLTKTA